ncbi:hypothetical protein [Brevibacillus laterosporus]|uniref:hypothetical protein n=1 Tax=Brevibacillus laterosporus TaxID=1465 RepID=UPI000CE5478B|nr:hypothetical protein [Brevibacillus laterosporus]AYB40518.1 hypothetical protein D5F52_21050 [Brevibacillus laterosporus]MBG9773357.1 hypothetical protein [Brevibacillus laterosporus]NKQ22832.1 hypothetical protein [Brevibacillus laterosporus]PPA80853.1 hypothetical protein C4A75_24185 [Brevibacillus laterosporus]WNX31268.1 hypothetical protein RWW94_24420 [Brevibacillus laterosporus]
MKSLFRPSIIAFLIFFSIGVINIVPSEKSSLWSPFLAVLVGSALVGLFVEWIGSMGRSRKK